MEKSNVKIGGEQNSETSKNYHWSLFELKTLKEFPFPSWVVPFTVLFFCLIWRGYERNYLPTSPVEYSLTVFVNTERSSTPKKPEILITGSSLNRSGIHAKVMENKIKKRIACTAISGGVAWEMQRIMMRYPHFFNDTKIVIYNISPSSLYKSSCHPRRLHLRQLGERANIVNNEHKNIDFITSCQPTRYSIRTIYQDLKFNVPYEKYFYDIANKKPLSHEDKDYNRLINTYTKNYKCDNDRIHEVHDFIKYCTDQGIYVIINVMPFIFDIPDSLPESNTADTDKRKFLVVLEDLKLLPNCSVITMQDRNVLRHPDKEIFFDPIHLTNDGAEVYTNWLADQMLKDQKIVAVLKTPRKTEDFFVKKYAKKSYRKFASYFKKETETNIKIAQPAGNPVK
jgi:hypothetical protein